MDEPFGNRIQAGQALARLLVDLHGRDDVIVLGLPRGGVPVAAEVARAIGAPLDVFTVRKLGVPVHEELAMGAVATGAVTITNPDIIDHYRVTAEQFQRVLDAETTELQRRERAYRGTDAPVAVAGKIAVLVDDGLATGTTMRAAVRAVRALGPVSIIVAVPVGSREAVLTLGREVDRVECVMQPRWFSALGEWYCDFRQTSDDEVRAALASV